MLDTAAGEMTKLRKECGQFAELASILELTDAIGPVTAAIKELSEDLVAVKDVWDCTALCDTQFQVSSQRTQVVQPLFAPHQPAGCTSDQQ